MFIRTGVYDSFLGLYRLNLFCSVGSNLVFGNKIEPVCCKKRQKSPNEETGLGNRGPLEALNHTKLILNY